MVYNPVIEIELEEALELDPDCEIGDELLIEVDPRIRPHFGSVRKTDRPSVHQGYPEGYPVFRVQGQGRRDHNRILSAERNGNIYVDLGKVEGILPKKFQSPVKHTARMIVSRRILPK